MRNDPTDPRQRPATRRSDDADLTDQFWGASSDWTASHPRTSRDPLTGGRSMRSTLSNTGIVAAIRDGMSAMKPLERDPSRPIDRTRTHGIVRPDSARLAEPRGDRRRSERVPLAADESTIAELAIGDIDDDFEPHPWERGVARRSSRRVDPTASQSSRLDHTGPIEFFDQEVDEIAGARDGFAAYADMEFESANPDTRSGVFATAGSRKAAMGLFVATVLAVPFLLSHNSGTSTDASDAVAVASVDAVTTTVAPISGAPGTTVAGATVASPGSATQTPSTAVTPAQAAATNENVASSSGAANAGAQPAVTAASSSKHVAETAATTTAVTTVNTPTTVAPATTLAETTVAPTTATPTTAAPTTTQPACALHYTAAAGDSWYRIADAAGVSPKSLLAANNATATSLILPGDDICLPEGAKKPTAPTTTTAPATTAPATTTPATTAPATTSAPTTTVASGSPGRNATPAQVQQIIRDVFPDDIEAKALDIARLESSYSPTAYNGWCCYGIFQIYYSVHASWLTQFGVYKAEDLYDPLVNARVALEIYRRAGNKFSPWTTA